MAPVDTAMLFWLRYVDHAGGLWESAGDSTVVVLPEHLQEEYGQSDDIRVTADPDVAREDGATLLLAGHPWLLQAAESVVGEGDCGQVQLPRPTGAIPGGDQLLAAAREQIPVDHGRIDAAGAAVPGFRSLVRVGVLVNYAVSSGVTFSEQMECWIDALSHVEVVDDVVDRLARLIDLEHQPESTATHPTAADVVRALQHADQVFNSRAAERAGDLVRQVVPERERETARATAYYADALLSLRRRLDAATSERAATLTAKIDSTEAERDRRLAEIAEKYGATHTILPFRLHAIAVPVLRMPVHVRRGNRRYPLTLDWLLSARQFATLRCPACRSTAQLVAAKTGLGCRDCLRRPVPQLVPADAANPPPVSTERPSATPSPSPKSAAEKSRATGKSGAAGKSPAAPKEKESPAAPQAKPVSTPPAASRRPSPPGARRRSMTTSSASRAHGSQVIQKAGHKLFTSLWELTAADDRRVQRLYAPNSPAAAMHTLFGLEAPLRVIGFDFASVPESISASDSAPAAMGRDMMVINGGLHSASQRYGHQLCWRFVGKTPLIEELTPFEGACWPRQPEPRYSPGWAAGQRLYACKPLPRVPLDPIAAEMWRVVAVYGLPATLRAVAAWWRRDTEDTRLARHSPTSLAAAIVRGVVYQAGLGGRYDDVAAAFQVEVGAVRAAAIDVQRQLQLSESQPW